MSFHTPGLPPSFLLSKGVAPMDTTNAVELKVGQKIQMRSGSLVKEVEVTEITEEYIEVKPVAFDQNERPWMIHFQKDGKQFAFGLGSNRCKDIGNLGVYDWCCGAWGRFDPRPLCGDGRNPWELVLMPRHYPGPSLML